MNMRMRTRAVLGLAVGLVATAAAGGNVTDTPEELIALDLTRSVANGSDYEPDRARCADTFVYPPVLEFPAVPEARDYALAVTDGTGGVRRLSSATATVDFRDFWLAMPTGAVSVVCQARDGTGKSLGIAARRSLERKAAFSTACRSPGVLPVAASCAAIGRAVSRLRADRDAAANRAFARDVARFCEDRFVDWSRPCGPDSSEAVARLVELWRELYRAEAYPLDLLKMQAFGADTAEFDPSNPDDTEMLQALLDRGGTVAVPKRGKPYLISRTLRIGSDTTLALAPDQRVVLRPRSDCQLLANRNPDGGDRNIAVRGGVWDMDNLRQSPNQAWRDWSEPPRKPLKVRPTAFSRDFYLGDALYFENVSNLVFSGATVRNPVTYAFHICRVTDFEVSHIRFDFTTENPIKGNMDGVHLDGGCRRGRILDLSGTTYDDLVALNANDVWCAQTCAEISDILIDGIRAEGAHSAVRMLSAPEPVRRVTIRNVVGSFYCYGIGFTHYFPERPDGLIEDVRIEHCRLRPVPAPPGKFKPPQKPMLYCNDRVRLNRITLDDVEVVPGE